jgi:hypothetical protein
MTFISIHSVIIYVVFFGACMRCTWLCFLKPGVTVWEEINSHKTKDISTINNGVKTGQSNGKGEGTSKGQIGKLSLSN